MSDHAINKITTLLPLTIYTAFYIIFTLSKHLSVFIIQTLVLIYCVIKAIERIDERNKYIKHISNSFRLNLINYPEEVSLNLIVY
jgi:hypothetical protein